MRKNEQAAVEPPGDTPEWSGVDDVVKNKEGNRQGCMYNIVTFNRFSHF